MKEGRWLPETQDPGGLRRNLDDHKRRLNFTGKRRERAQGKRREKTTLTQFLLNY